MHILRRIASDLDDLAGGRFVPSEGRTIRQLAIGVSWPNQHSNLRNYPHGAGPQFERVNEFDRSLPVIVRLAHTK
jgi:hypothetical protein